MTTLITGASKGIGRALAHEFARHGHDLVVCARDHHLLIQLAETLKTQYSVQVDTIAIDLSRRDGATNLINAIEAKGHIIECLVNNAGLGYLGEFTDMSIQNLQELIQLNMVTLTELTHYYARAFKKANMGKILQVASTAAFQPGPLMAVYYASKAYVVSLSQAIAHELKENDVTVSILCPGVTRTDFFKEANMQGSLLERGFAGMMTPEKVAAIAYSGLSKNKRFIIPGFFNKLAAYSAIFIPDFIAMRVAAYLHRK